VFACLIAVRIRTICFDIKTSVLPHSIFIQRVPYIVSLIVADLSRVEPASAGTVWRLNKFLHHGVARHPDIAQRDITRADGKF